MVQTVALGETEVIDKDTFNKDVKRDALREARLRVVLEGPAACSSLARACRPRQLQPAMDAMVEVTPEVLRFRFQPQQTAARDHNHEQRQRKQGGLQD